MSADNIYLDRAKALQPVLAGRAVATDARRQLLPETVADIKAAGFHRMSQPKRFGGAEQPLQRSIEVIATLASACASTAWVCGLWNDHALALTKFDPRAAELVWGKNPDATVSAGFTPSGTVERVTGGFRIAGTWSWSSGCDYADWFLVASLLPLTEGPPTPSLCLVPRSAVTIDDNWHFLGLNGTGSKNIVLESMVVPEHHVLPMAISNLGIPPGRTDLSLVHRLPHVTHAPFLFTAAGIGIAEGMLAMTIEWLTKRKSAAGTSLVDLQSMHLHLAEAAAEIDCARLLVMRDLTASMQAMADGRTISLPEKARNRRDQAYSGRLCRRAVDRLYSMAGANGMYDSSALQRKFRDMCAVSAHISSSWDLAGTAYGRVSLGLDPNTFLI